MILTIILLFLFGVFAIILEVALPFGISAALGVAVIAFSGYLAVQAAGPVGGTIYLVIALFIVTFTAYWSIRSGLRLIRLKSLNPDDSARADGEDADADYSDGPPIGALAAVVQPLRPTGTIEWEGRRLSARTIHPEQELAVGSTVRVVERDSIYFIVEESSGEAG